MFWEVTVIMVTIATVAPLVSTASADTIPKCGDPQVLKVVEELAREPAYRVAGVRPYDQVTFATFLAMSCVPNSSSQLCKRSEGLLKDRDGEQVKKSLSEFAAEIASQIEGSHFTFSAAREDGRRGNKKVCSVDSNNSDIFGNPHSGTWHYTVQQTDDGDTYVKIIPQN
jgi:hypothetical protein